MTTGIPLDGNILFRVQMAAVMHPAASSHAAPKRPVYHQDHFTTKAPVHAPAKAPEFRFVSRSVVASHPTATIGGLSGTLWPNAGQRLTAAPTMAIQPKPVTSTSLFSSVGGWLVNRASGLFDTVRSSLPFGTSYDDPMLANRQSRSVSVARGELNAGVKEQGNSNRGRRIDEYARTAGMPTGEKWCGFFVGYAYSQSGFKEPEDLASVIKARCFFLYSSAFGADKAKSSQQAQGQTRQYFMLSESPSRAYIRENQRQFPQFNVDAHTFSWRTLPVRSGDTILFERGAHGDNPGTHVGIVESYDPLRGRLTTIEGNVNNAVVRKTYDLTDPGVRREITGFGRPAPGDFT